MRLLNPGGLTYEDELRDELIAQLEVPQAPSPSTLPKACSPQAAPPSPSTIEEPGRMCKSLGFLC